jgi:hypothetical protein
MLARVKRSTLKTETEDDAVQTRKGTLAARSVGSRTGGTGVHERAER